MEDSTMIERFSPMKHKVVVYAAGGECRVTPGHLVAEPEDEIYFMPVNTEISVLFPYYSEEIDLPRQVLRVRPEEYQVVQLPPNMPDGVYPYAVYCHHGRSFARGGSDPVIIVRKSI
jgi:hypothetical protein